MSAISTLGQALEQIERIKTQQTSLADLSRQLASGKKTDRFSGLGTQILSSKRARADLGAIETYMGNITHAERRIELMLNAIEEFQAQARNFKDSLINLSQQSAHQEGEIYYYDDPLTTADENEARGMTSNQPDVDFSSLQDMAEGVFDLASSLLNRQDGDRYIFSGKQTTTQPLGDTGLLDTKITALLADWRGGGLSNTDLASALEETDTSVNADAVTDSITGYAAELSSGNAGSVFFRVDDSIEVDYTVVANDSAFRDILVATAYFKSADLPPIADHYDSTGTKQNDGAPGLTLDEQKDNFYAVYNEVVEMAVSAIDRMDRLRFDLEGARIRINDVKERHVEERTLLLSTIADIEDVDMSEVAVEINMLQVQLDASLRVTARLQQMSLVNFI